MSWLSMERKFSARVGGSGPGAARWNGTSPFDCCPSRGCQRLRDHSSRQASSFRRTMIKTPLETLRCGWWHHPLPASPASWKKWHDPHLCFATPSPRSGQRVGAARRPRVAARARRRKTPVSPATALGASAVFSPPVRRRFYQPTDGLSIRHSGCGSGPSDAPRLPVMPTPRLSSAAAPAAILTGWRAERRKSRVLKSPPLGDTAQL